MERVSYLLAVAISSLSEVSGQQPGNVVEISADNKGHGHGHLHHPNKVGPDPIELESVVPSIDPIDEKPFNYIEEIIWNFRFSIPGPG